MFKGHPKGLIAAALSNMGERFGYYIMNAVLVLFLCSKFGLEGEKAGVIYSVFYAGIYLLSLVGGFIADRTQNYKGTIATGLIIMAVGYIILSVPVLATPENNMFLLSVTCVALFLIAFGNGLFKGNLQAVVGQMYDNLEEEAAKKGPEALKAAKGMRDPGFQIFYVFINVGGLIAPFVAPLLRSAWLKTNGLTYDAGLPELCHKYINGTIGDQMTNLTELMAKAGGDVNNMFESCQTYLKIFNEGVHFSFIASVAAMFLSLIIFMIYKKGFPTPAKKEAVAVEDYTPEEKIAMAKEIKQRMYALFAVLGVAIFFWFAFHQNGMSLSLFAKDFVKTDAIAPEIWQAVNPFFVITLTPVIIAIFTFFANRGKVISTPRKIAIGMFIVAVAYLFLALFSMMKGYPAADTFKTLPVAEQADAKAGWWVLIVTYFFLTVAELFISPLGLSFVSKVAPKSMLGLCQGLWLGATALGNLLLWIGPILYAKLPLWQCWSVFMVVCLISMGVMLGMLKWLERVTK